MSRILFSDEFLQPLIDAEVLPEMTQECIIVCRARQAVQVYIVGLGTEEWKSVSVGMEVGVKMDAVPNPATSEGTTMGAQDGSERS